VYVRLVLLLLPSFLSFFSPFPKTAHTSCLSGIDIENLMREGKKETAKARTDKL
jgi:hypothetical protein